MVRKRQRIDRQGYREQECDRDRKAVGDMEGLGVTGTHVDAYKLQPLLPVAMTVV